jgi:Pyridoxamine 5'-phosphate oxidase
MGQSNSGITPELSEWIDRQRMFFVATAPLAGDGLINCSPKGLDTFRVLGPREVAYLDLTGSGVETIAHSRENGRIVFMFCAFEGAPKIVRLHGRSEVLLPDSPEFKTFASLFPEYLGHRAIIRAFLTRISDSCGYGVPRYEYAGDRDTLMRWSAAKGPEGLRQYRGEKNARSLDDLPGLTPGSD